MRDCYDSLLAAAAATANSAYGIYPLSTLSALFIIIQLCIISVSPQPS